MTTISQQKATRKKHTGEPGNRGEFGTTRRQESGLQLSDADTAHMNELLAAADKAAAVLARKMRGGQGWDHEDLAQDVKIEIVARARRYSTTEGMTPAWVRFYTNGLIARVADVTRQGRSPAEHYRARHETMAAYREFTETVAEQEKKLGHALSPVQRDRIAVDIRENWPDRNHRPPEGFNLDVRVFSADCSTDGGDDSGRRARLEARTEVPSAEDTYLASGGRDWADIDDLPAVRRVFREPSKAANRKYGWNAIAATRGVPTPVVRLNNRQVATIRAEVGRTEDDVRAAIADYHAGADTARVREFFRPFGATDADHREQVVEVLEDNPAYLRDLFDAAVAGATARNFT